MTVLLISFKQYDRGSRPNLGEGGPLAGEGAGGVEKGVGVEGESWGRVGPGADTQGVCRKGVAEGRERGEGGRE